MRPLLKYGAESNKLEKTQYEAVRIITGAAKLVSINSLFNETELEPLDSRRRKYKLTLFYKMIKGLRSN